MELTELRHQLDEIDRKLVAVFQERMELSAQIAAVKLEIGKPVYDYTREQNKLEAVSELLPDPLKCYALPLYSRIMELSREYQNHILHSSDLSCNSASYQLGNLILIGMPGCGKSSIAVLLGQALQRSVVDSDAELENHFGSPVGTLLLQNGESTFRQMESGVLQELCKKRGLIIATGGGCVTHSENRDILRNSGTVIWIRRDLNRLSTHARPLSQLNSVEALWKERSPLYKDFSDFCVENNGSVFETTDQICRHLGYLPLFEQIKR